MRHLGRRAFALLAASFTLGSRVRAAPAVPRFGIADVSNDVSIDLRDIDKRLAIYKDTGFGMVRTAAVWSEFEKKKGEWALSPARQRYLEAIAKSGLKLKLEVSALHSAPDWFFAENPNAHPRNAEGRTARQLISVWHPQVNAVVAEKQARMMGSLGSLGLLEHVATIVASLGPAGEPIFPAQWQTEGGGKQSFWFYDENAAPHFRAAMERKFGGDLKAANERWNTGFKAWREVVIAAPGASRGPRWEDVLIWYRDSKRAVVDATLRDIQSQTKAKAAAGTPVIMLVPGTHTSDAAWSDAIATGDGDTSVKVMTDTDHLLDLAKETGVWLQHTAGQNEPAIRYLQAGMKTRGFETPLWAENAGGKPAQDPSHLADVVLNNRLHGLDYIGGADLFAADRITPGPVMPLMKAAAARMREGLRAP